MYLLESFSITWQVAEPTITITSLLFGIFLFFKDPIRRWQFLGYNPTLIALLIDPQKQILGLIKMNKYWVPIQGGIYDPNIYSDIDRVLSREVGISSDKYDLKNVQELGAIKFSDKKRLKKRFIGGIRLFRQPKGKGYIVCFLEVNSDQILKNYKLGYGIKKFKFFDINEGIDLMKKSNADNLKKYESIEKVIRNLNY